MNNLEYSIEDDIREWAANPNAIEPQQDWDLMLADIEQTNLYIELASDDECPNSEYFLSVLYLIVGDAVRTEYQTKEKNEISALIKNAESMALNKNIQLWVSQSKELMHHPEQFNYNEWCTGGLARLNKKTA